MGDRESIIEDHLMGDPPKGEPAVVDDLINLDMDLMASRSIMLPSLGSRERLLHEFIDTGDAGAVYRILKENRALDINAENYQGISALHRAVKTKNIDIIKMIVDQPDTLIGDSHLVAIRENDIDVAVILLDKLRPYGIDVEMGPVIDSAEFPSNVTPLMLAAESGHYEMVRMLLGRGHTVPRPHMPDCFCAKECLAGLSTQDPLNAASGKLKIYRAISNPTYLSLTTDDPIMAAFKLSRELLIAAEVDSIYRSDYEELATQTKEFAVALIGYCRTSEEVETILRERRGSSYLGALTFPRLVLAMDYKQKEFIAHPNVQEL